MNETQKKQPNQLLVVLGLLALIAVLFIGINVIFAGLGAMLPCTKAQRERIMGFNDFADKLAAQAVRQPCWHLPPSAWPPPAKGRASARP